MPGNSQSHLSAVQADRTGKVGVQSRLAGAILAHNCMHLADLELEGNIAQGRNTEKALGDTRSREHQSATACSSVGVQIAIVLTAAQRTRLLCCSPASPLRSRNARSRRCLGSTSVGPLLSSRPALIS